MTNPRCFLDLSVDGEPVGRVIFELFADKVPKTAENFRALCTGEKGLSPFEGLPMSYAGCPVHRIIPDFMIQSGDYTQRNGKGGYSIYGGPFEDEDLAWRDVDEAGLLVMANKGPDTNNSQFFVTLRPCPHLNGKHVVFGRVVRGYEVVEKVSTVETGPKDAPLRPVTIHHCGELVKASTSTTKTRKRSASIASSSSSAALSSSSTGSASMSESDSEKDRRRKRHGRSRHHHRRSKHRSSGRRSRSPEDRARPDRRDDAPPRAAAKDREPPPKVTRGVDVDAIEERRRRDEDERRRIERARDLEALKKRIDWRDADGAPDKQSVKYKGRGVMKAPSGPFGGGSSRMRGWD